MKECILSFLMIIVIILLFLLLRLMTDFYNDYKCSTTTDIKWFNENNCIKYFNNKKGE